MVPRNNVKLVLHINNAKFNKVLKFIFFRRKFVEQFRYLFAYPSIAVLRVLRDNNTKIKLDR